MLGPLDHSMLTDAGVAADTIGTLEGRYPLTFASSSLPPGGLDRLATDYYELYAATRPARIYETSGSTKRTSFRYRLGYVAFNTPETRWSAKWESRIEGFSLYIQPQIFDETVKTVFGEDPGEVIWRGLLGDYVPSIAFLALDIGSQAAAGYPAGVAFVERQVETLLAMLARRYSSSPSRDTRLIGIHSAAVLRAIQYINQRLTADLTVQDIADAAAASPPHLNRLFRAELGVSVWSYVQSRRLAAIKADLARADADPDKIARAYGYASFASLNAIHRRKFGAALPVSA